MNIWLVNHYANPPDAPGDARHFSHARELIERGHQVRIVSCSVLHLQGAHIPAIKERDWNASVHEGVPFTWIRGCACQGESLGRIRNMFEFAFRVARLDWAAGLTAPDLVLGSSPHPFAALAAERVAAHYRVPFVLEVRDAWPYVLTEIGGHSRLHPFVMLVDWTMRYLYARASRIVMFSRNSASLLEQGGAAAKKIVWIPHGVDFKMCPKPGPPPLDDIFTVTYIGAHNQWNSLDAVLDAAKILQSSASGVRFRFVGEGAMRAGLIERARSESIANVKFDGPIPKQHIPEILRTSDAFIINNRNDGASKRWMSFNKLYEYLAAGRPVVFGSCTEDNPVEESGAGISVEADNPQALANAVAFLARQSSEQLEEYGRRGRSHIEEQYSIPALVDRFEAVACELTGRSRGVLSLASTAQVVHGSDAC